MPNKSLKKKINKKKTVRKNIKGGSVKITGNNTQTNSVNTNKPVITINARNEIVSPFTHPHQETKSEHEGGKKINKKKKGGNLNIPVDIKTNIPYTQQWQNPNVQAPLSQYQGGIYTGPQAFGPWGFIPVTPTTSNMINNNLNSSSPPPGANTQYPGTNRLGNNYIPMPGVFWYSDTNPVNKGPYSMKVTNQKWLKT